MTTSSEANFIKFYFTKNTVRCSIKMLLHINNHCLLCVRDMLLWGKYFKILKQLTMGIFLSHVLLQRQNATLEYETWKKLNFSSCMFLFMSIKRQCYLFMLSSLKAVTWWIEMRLLLTRIRSVECRICLFTACCDIKDYCSLPRDLHSLQWKRDNIQLYTVLVAWLCLCATARGVS